MSRISREEMFCGIIRVIEKRSTCLRSKVAALIEKDGRIISLGYNGPASGMPECTPASEIQRIGWDDYDSTTCLGKGCNRSIHAEQNAIAFAARAGIPIEGATLYCSMSPCINCAKLIINSGIREVVYLGEYRDTEGVELLKKANIKTLLFPPSREMPDAIQIGNGNESLKGE